MSHQIILLDKNSVKRASFTLHKGNYPDIIELEKEGKKFSRVGIQENVGYYKEAEVLLIQKGRAGCITKKS